MYITTAGDTFDLISLKVYGTTENTVALMESNPDLLDYVIFPSGISINVPVIAFESLDTSIPPWKRG